MDTQREAELGKTYDLALLRRLWHYVRPYRTRFLLALVCLPLTSACVLAQPYLLKLAVDRYMANHDAEGLAVVGMLFAGVLVGEFIFFYTQFHATMLMAQHSLADLRRDLFAHLQELPASFFERTPVGRLVTRLTTDVDAINEAFSAGTLTIFMDVLTMVGIVTIMLLLDARLALVALLLVPPLLVALNFFGCGPDATIGRFGNAWRGSTRFCRKPFPASWSPTCLPRKKSCSPSLPSATATTATPTICRISMTPPSSRWSRRSAPSRLP